MNNMALDTDTYMLTVNSYSHECSLSFAQLVLHHTKTPFEKKASLQKELSSDNLDKPSYKLKAFHAKPKVLLHLSICARIYNTHMLQKTPVHAPTYTFFCAHAIFCSQFPSSTASGSLSILVQSCIR